MSETYQFSIGRTRAVALAGCFVAAAALLFFAGTIVGLLVSNGRQATLRAASSAPIVKPAPLPEAKSSGASGGPSAVSTAQAASGETGQAQGSSTDSANAATLTAPPMTASSQDNAPSMQAEAGPKPEASAFQSPTPFTVVTANNLSGSPAAGLPAAMTSPIATQAKSRSTVSEAASPRLVQTSYAIPLAVKVSSFLVKSNADALMVSLRDLGYRPVMTQFTDTRGQLWYLVKLGPYNRWNTASAVATRVSLEEDVRPIIGPMR